METYQTSHIKRNRSTKAEVEARRAALYGIVRAMKPMTVRQVFYQATVAGIIEKSEAGYNKVQTDLVQMRKGRRAFPIHGSPITPAGNANRARSDSVERALQETRNLVSQGAVAQLPVVMSRSGAKKMHSPV